MDNDDKLDGLVEQVEAALDALNIGDDATRDAVVDGLRDAFKTVKDLNFSDLNFNAEVETPEVVVIDGGREGEEEVEDEVEAKPRPELHIVEDEESISPEVTTMGDVKVRVIHPHTKTARTRRFDLQAQGEINLAGRSWQTLFRGESSRTYRLCCRTGVLDVALNGALVEQLKPGQTIDIEANLIRVRAETDEEASGSYVRLNPWYAQPGRPHDQ
ncbi:MAG: hypothetical protein HN348_20260 [Proteobacteria bacterium]|nr:hypothetical protein [Pseudomonadota bacterium]